MDNKYDVNNYIKEYNDLCVKQNKICEFCKHNDVEEDFCNLCKIENYSHFFNKRTLKDFIIEKVTEASIEDYNSNDGFELYNKYIEDEKMYNNLAKIKDEYYNKYKIAKEKCDKQFFVYDKSEQQYKEALKDYIANCRLKALEALDSHCSKDFFEKTEYTCNECGKVCDPHFKYNHSYFCSKECLYKSFGLWGDGTDETWHRCKNCGEFVGHHIVTNTSEDMFCSCYCACKYYNIDILRT